MSNEEEAKKAVYIMQGIDAKTGKALDGIAHLEQSIKDILTTQIGTRVFLRNYGSNIPRLIDSPVNRQTIPQIYAATAEALDMWEPRLKLQQVSISDVTDQGSLTIAVTGLYQGTKISISTEILR